MHHTLQAVNVDPEKWEDYDPPRYLAPSERTTYWGEQQNDMAEEQQAEADFYDNF